jgi:CheY-like chemotaxis protein
MQVNDKDLLDEIRYDIQVKDVIKGKLVLAALEHVSRKAQRQALFEVSRADNGYAIPLLATVIAEHPEITKSFPQIQETLYAKCLESPEVLLDLIAGSKKPGQVFYIEMAGELRVEKAVPLLLDILRNEQDGQVVEETLVSLGVIGHASAADAVSEYLYAGNREIVVAAVHSLGQLGTRRAVEHLAKRLGGDTDIDVMIVDILAKAQVPDALEMLNDTLGSQHAHIRNAGKKKLRAIGTTAIRVLIRNLAGNNTDLIIHSLNVLGDIADEAAVPPIRRLLHNEPREPNVRFAAYEALGKIPLGKGAFVLSVGLVDPDASVRAAAAKAIDRNFNVALAGGLMNLVATGDPQAVEIVHTIIDSECDHIFAGLLEEDSFSKPALAYLKGKAHPDVRAHFGKLLKDKGAHEPADAGTGSEESVGARKLKVFVVDDSKMILNIYRKVLHSLGYEPHLFEFPAGALERIRHEKPDIIVTDLNMPDITGIDLTRRVREVYPKEDVPVIMVTTQDDGQDNAAAFAAGINAFLQKPFTEEQIGAVLAEFKRS